MRDFMGVLAIGFSLVCSPAFSQHAESAHEQTVRDFMAAFNRQDSDAMSRLVTDDVQWLSIDGDAISVETDGRTALLSAMNSYFESCPTCRSRLAALIASRDRVSAIETASWQGKNGPQTQSGASVYEFSEGLIKRVYYFPAEK